VQSTRREAAASHGCAEPRFPRNTRPRSPRSENSPGTVPRSRTVVPHPDRRSSYRSSCEASVHSDLDVRRSDRCVLSGDRPSGFTDLDQRHAAARNHRSCSPPACRRIRTPRRAEGEDASNRSSVAQPVGMFSGRSNGAARSRSRSRSPPHLRRSTGSPLAWLCMSTS